MGGGAGPSHKGKRGGKRNQTSTVKNPVVERQESVTGVRRKHIIKDLPGTATQGATDSIEVVRRVAFYRENRTGGGGDVHHQKKKTCSIILSITVSRNTSLLMKLGTGGGTRGNAGTGPCSAIGVGGAAGGKGREESAYVEGKNGSRIRARDET